MEFLRLSCILMLVSVALSTYTQVINTTDGFVQGILIQTLVGRTVRAYLGIPYSAPPIGNLRFQRPTPLPERWPNVLLADKYSKSCIQGINPRVKEWWIPDDEDTSEDCLTLNIWAPMDVRDAAVMVWIHGGAFEGGTSSSYKYDGQLLAALGNVIVVTINYRLHVLGFLYMGDELADEVPGNVGLIDQSQALQWVRNNIKQFGGDPNKVTIFGQSAGAAAVNYHLTIPYETRPFQRVIIQSGTSNAIWAYTDNKLAEALSEKILEATGCSTIYTERAELLDCLRSYDVRDLVKSTFQVPSTSPSRVKWTPIIDGSFITEDSETFVKNGNVGKDIDIMIGTTTEDGSYFAVSRGPLQLKEDSFIDNKTFQQAIKAFIGTDNDFVAILIQHFYTNWEHPSDPVLIRRELIHFITDLFFHCKTNDMSDLLESNGNRVYRYQFSHHPSDSPFPKWFGAAHTDEISFVFGLPYDVTLNFTHDECYLSTKMIYYWSNFAKYGTPTNPRFQNQWPKYTEDKRYYLEIGLPPIIKSGHDLRYKECAMWSELLPKIKTAINNVKLDLS